MKSRKEMTVSERINFCEGAGIEDMYGPATMGINNLFPEIGDKFQTPNGVAEIKKISYDAGRNSVKISGTVNGKAFENQSWGMFEKAIESGQATIIK